MNDTLNFTSQVLKELLGPDMSPVTLTVAYIFAGCGLILRWYWMYYRKGKTNELTPIKFSLGFWLRDNAIHKALGVLVTIIVIFISLRFPQSIAGEGFSYLYALSVGLLFDYWIDKLKNLQPHRQAAEQAGIEIK